tara:strand:- start:287 stop:499 length:213 start_codon:yes stop_codon:yes gene_type:complete
MASVVIPRPRPVSYPFINITSIVITHNLGYFPLVYCIVNGELIMCEVAHTSNSELIVSFALAISGFIFLR